MNYQDFLNNKKFVLESSGFDIDKNELNPKLFDYEKDIVRWALAKGRAAIFADCGLGKTAMQLEWANQVSKRTGGKVLILAPLAVAPQTAKEGEKFGIEAIVCESQSDCKKISITNYEKLDRFIVKEFTGIVLDESSILKSFTGKVRTQIIDTFNKVPYKLACTATPSPNDYMELGNHSEFLYTNDCEGEADAEHCKAVYGIIKDYDDDICYGYCGRSDCAMFKDFKQLIKDGADTGTGIEWY